MKTSFDLHSRILLALSVCGASSALITDLITDDLWLALRVCTGSLTVCLGYWGTLMLLSYLQASRKPRYNAARQARHRAIQAHQLGESYRDGYTRNEVLLSIAGLLATLLAMPLLYLITCVVFGTTEPRW
jgi:hypothetical protein